MGRTYINAVSAGDGANFAGGTVYLDGATITDTSGGGAKSVLVSGSTVIDQGGNSLPQGVTVSSGGFVNEMNSAN